MKTTVYNWQNEAVGEMELPKGLFGAAWRPAVVQQVVLAQLANARKPWAHAKDRSEVRGGGRKPWRQKGTGRARHGSIRSPLWSGGGKAHGPLKDRDYTQKVNKKVKRAALGAVLSKKLADGELKIIDSLMIDAPKTKIVALKIKAFIAPKAKKADILFVVGPENKHLFRAAKNIPKTAILGASTLNVYDLMNYKQVLVERDAVAVIEKHYASI